MVVIAVGNRVPRDCTTGSTDHDNPTRQIRRKPTRRAGTESGSALLRVTSALRRVLKSVRRDFERSWCCDRVVEVSLETGFDPRQPIWFLAISEVTSAFRLRG